jgi:hypothetical protein
MLRTCSLALLPLLAACSKSSEPARSDTANDPQGAKAPASAAAGQDPHAGLAGSPHGASPAGSPHAGAPSPHGAGSAGGAQPTAADGTKAFAAFTLTVPKEWKESAPSGGMRAAQFAIAGDAGKDAELVIYYFGNAGAGGVDANLERWYGQFEQPDGSATSARAERKEKKVDGLDVTLAKASGTYVAAVQPGSSDKHNEAGWALLAAIVQTDAGPYYFKLVGPGSTVTKAEPVFTGMIESIRRKGG